MAEPLVFGFPRPLFRMQSSLANYVMLILLKEGWRAIG